MKRLRFFFICCSLLTGSLCPRVAAQTLPPATIQYQGRVSVAGAAHNGTGYFKFLLYAPDKRLWSNDDSHGGAEPLDGFEPAGSVSVSVSAGLFSADLGSGAMPAITPGAFFDGTGNVRGEVSLRVWFSPTGIPGLFVKLSPDRKLSSVPFALVAGTVAKGAVTNDKLAPDAVTSEKIKNGAVSAGKLAAGAAAANLNAGGSSGVGSGGILFSATGDNAALATAGYVRIGMAGLNEFWSRRAGGTAAAARSGHTAVWTGSEMIVWGGLDGSNDGGRYNPATDTWSAMNPANAPAARDNPAAVWTGSEMIVWGGFSSSEGGLYLNDGGRYNPATDTWSPVSTSGAPAGRSYPTAIWTGSRMIVWGGYFDNGGNQYWNDGGRYDPAANSWTALSTAGAPSARYGHSAVWTGSAMIVWGGTGGGILNDGARYSPAGNSWTAVSDAGAPAARYAHSAVWTGSEMIVWGGYGDLNSGARYHPATDTWAAVSTSGSLAGRSHHTAVWTGGEMIVWGGHYYDSGSNRSFGDGARYHPATDTWTAMTTAGAPAARYGHTAVWTGSEMLVHGGKGDSLLNDTGVYIPPKTMFLYQRQ